MDANGRTLAAGALVLLCITASNTAGNGSASCSVQLTRQDALQLLAEGYVRARNNLPPKSSVDSGAVDEAKRGIAAQLEKGWEIQVKQETDCSFTITYRNPKRFGGGFSVFADEKKRLVDIFQHR